MLPIIIPLSRTPSPDPASRSRTPSPNPVADSMFEQIKAFNEEYNSTLKDENKNSKSVCNTTEEKVAAASMFEQIKAFNEEYNRTLKDENKNSISVCNTTEEKVVAAVRSPLTDLTEKAIQRVNRSAPLKRSESKTQGRDYHIIDIPNEPDREGYLPKTPGCQKLKDLIEQYPLFAFLCRTPSDNMCIYPSSMQMMDENKSKYSKKKYIHIVHDGHVDKSRVLKGYLTKSREMIWLDQGKPIAQGSLDNLVESLRRQNYLIPNKKFEAVPSNPNGDL